MPATGRQHAWRLFPLASANRVRRHSYALPDLSNTQHRELNSFADTCLAVWSTRKNVPPIPPLLATASRHFCHRLVDCSDDILVAVVAEPLPARHVSSSSSWSSSLS